MFQFINKHNLTCKKNYHKVFCSFFSNIFNEKVSIFIASSRRQHFLLPDQMANFPNIQQECARERGQLLTRQFNEHDLIKFICALMPFAALPPGLAAGNIKRHWEINQAHTRRTTASPARPVGLRHI